MPNRLHLLGQTFGRLTVISAGTLSPAGYWYLCRCTCGNAKWIRSRSLTSPQGTRSCGCLRVEWYRRQWTYHGGAKRIGTDMKKRALYVAWGNMKSRCWTRTNPAFKHYGGRGITICASWTFFAIFWRDMQATRSPGLSLERLDNEDGYHRLNCAWISQTRQLENRRPNGNGKHADEPF